MLVVVGDFDQVAGVRDDEAAVLGYAVPGLGTVLGGLGGVHVGVEVDDYCAELEEDLDWVLVKESVLLPLGFVRARGDVGGQRERRSYGLHHYPG